MATTKSIRSSDVEDDNFSLMTLPAAIRINTPRIVHEEVEGQVVAIDFEPGVYYGLAGVAADVWGAIGEGVRVDALLDAAGRRYPDAPATVSDEIGQFLDQLDERELIVTLEGEPPVHEVWGESLGSPYALPKLEVHTDMQDILLLDPIHDVSDAGWPKSAPGDRTG